MDKYLAWDVRPFPMPHGQEAVGTVQMLNAIVNYIYPETERHLNRSIQYNKAKLQLTYNPK
jgi:hypothetical protein